MAFEALRPVLKALEQRGPGLSTPEAAADDRKLSEIDKGLTPAIDLNRDLLASGAVRQARKGLLALLESLPSGASAYIAFRIKANIGHCYYQLGETDDAFRWLEDAIATNPTEPRAIAVQAYVKIAAGEPADALRYARAQLEINPTNDHLAAHLIEAAILIKDGPDPEPFIPVALRDRERVIVARCVLYRLRGNSAWSNLARLGASRFPDNEVLQLFACEAEVEQVARENREREYRPISAAQRSRLQSAASRLQARWTQIKASDVPRRDDGLAALHAAMIARTLLDEGEEAMSLARDLIEYTDEAQPLMTAAQMAQILGDEGVAAAALAKLPDSGPSAFMKGIEAAGRHKWEVAANYFSQAEVPEPERVFVDMLTHLAGIEAMDEATARNALTDAVTRYASDARGMIVVCGMAEHKRLPEIANQAYRTATSLIGPTLGHAARVMIAAHAYRSDDFEVIIRALDGYVETGAWSRVLQWLADAHAADQPPRRRNLRFFEDLPQAVLNNPSIARAHASKLLDFDQPDRAEPILRQVIAQTPDDVFSQLKLVQALDALGLSDDAKATVLAADEAAMKGPNGYLLQWAHRLRASGAPQRALNFVYDLLRSRPNDYRMALGYVAVVFSDRSEIIIPQPSKVTSDSWVAIESSTGERDNFIIDDGQGFMCIDAVPPSHARARRVLGLGVGESVASASGVVVTWTVREIKSKYLAVLHHVMETFERRFPTANGLWRIELKGDDLQPVLDMVRERAKAKQETTQRFYVDKHVPLTFSSRAIGTDILSFAQYLRTMGLEIVTAGGSAAEVQAGIDTAQEYRGAGAVLDTYTAITAAEMGCLDVIIGWFDKVAIPASTIALIDSLLAQARDGLGKEALSVGWKDGQFFGEELNDNVLHERIRQLEAVRQTLTTCEVAPFVAPDDLAPDVAEFARTNGRDGIDAMYLAAARGDILVSDDLFYRQMAHDMTRVDGTWLQAVFLAAHVAGNIDRGRYGKACAQLAARRHGHLWIDDAALLLFSQECTEVEFAAVCHYVGTRTAHMAAHNRLVRQFLKRIWRQPEMSRKREPFTSIAVRALLRHRQDDWHWQFALLWLGIEQERSLAAYLSDWARGHFMPAAPIIAALHRWRFFLMREEPMSAFSRRAVQAANWPLEPVKLDLGIPLKETTTASKTDRSASWSLNPREGKRSRRRKCHRGKQ